MLLTDALLALLRPPAEDAIIDGANVGYYSRRVTDSLLALLRQPAVDAIIDGANVGYYSKRPDQGHTLSYSQVAVVQ